MSYVDGFVATVPTANQEAYCQHAEIAAAIFNPRANVSMPAICPWKRSTGSKLSRRTFAAKLVPPVVNPPIFKMRRMTCAPR